MEAELKTLMRKFPVADYITAFLEAQDGKLVCSYVVG